MLRMQNHEPVAISSESVQTKGDPSIVGVSRLAIMSCWECGLEHAPKTHQQAPNLSQPAPVRQLHPANSV